MGRKHGLGRSLVKHIGSEPSERSGRHVVRTNTAGDWSRLPVHSVTEQTGLDEFFNIANLANHEFKAQKKNIRLLAPSEIMGIPSSSDCSKISEVHIMYKDLLKIPRS